MEISIKDVINSPFPRREKYNSIIPLKLFQTWKTKELHPELKKNIDKIKSENPEFEYHLFDDNDCYEFIKTHFGPDVFMAYNSLIPGAYKADLWRLCVLYIHGGIYMDMRFELVNNFKLIELTEKEHFVLERKGHWMPNKHGIYNALIVSKPQNHFLMNCINEIVKNVRNQYYGYNPFYPTGPGLLWLVFEKNPFPMKNNIDIFHVIEGSYLAYKKHIILKSLDKYDDYRNKSTIYYANSWKDKNIYRSINSNYISQSNNIFLRKNF